MIAAGFGGPTELAQGEDRHVQFLGQHLQGSGNRRQLLLPVLELAAALHELQVIDHEHVETMLQLQTAGLRPHLEDADRGRIIDEEFRLVEAPKRGGQARVVLLAEVASRNRCASTRASDVSSRRNNCSFDISKLNIPTVFPPSMPQCDAMFRTRLVLPIEGRAATITRSAGWNPDVNSSRSTNPLGTPVTRPRCCSSRSSI